MPRALEDKPTNEIPTVNTEQFYAPMLHLRMGKAITKYRNLVNDPDLELRITYRNGLGKEFGNMAQGKERTGKEGMNAIFILPHVQIAAIPKSKAITYTRIIVDFRPQKEDPNRVRMTADGNFIKYAGKLAARTSDSSTAKILRNGIVSTKGAQHTCFDISNMYHSDLTEDYECTRIPLDISPEHKYNQAIPSAQAREGRVHMWRYGTHRGPRPRIVFVGRSPPPAAGGRLAFQRALDRADGGELCPPLIDGDARGILSSVLLI